MQYSFNSKVAEKYGVDGAIMIENLYFWISKNKANNKHLHEGYYWTYNSMKAFTKLFPFWTHRQIERILKNLEKDEAIVVGTFNKSSYDHTRWYRLTRYVKAIYVNGEINLTKSVNQINENVKPIPDNKHKYETQIINTDNIKIQWDKILIAWNDLPNPIKPIKAITDRRKDKIKARINSLTLTQEDIIQAISNIKKSSFLQGKNNRNWIIDINWLFQDDTRFCKVLEGKYNDKEGGNNDSPKHKKGLDESGLGFHF